MMASTSREAYDHAHGCRWSSVVIPPKPNAEAAGDKTAVTSRDVMAKFMEENPHNARAKTNWRMRGDGENPSFGSATGI